MEGTFDSYLIAAVESKKILYDRGSAGYKNEEAKLNAWKSVYECVKEAGFDINSVEEVQQNWLRLRQRYSRERSKIPISGSNASSEKEWELLGSLSFLERHVKHRKTQSNIVRAKPAVVYSGSSHFSIPLTEVDAETTGASSTSSTLNVDEDGSEEDDPVEEPIQSLWCKRQLPQKQNIPTPDTFYKKKQKFTESATAAFDASFKSIQDVAKKVEEKLSTGDNEDEQALTAFIRSLLPFWKNIPLRVRARIMAETVTKFSEAMVLDEK